MWLKQSAAATVTLPPLLDSTDGNTNETGLTVAAADVYLSKNGGAMTAKNDATAATVDATTAHPRVPLDATDTGTLGRLVVYVHVAGALYVEREYLVLPANVYDSLVAGSDTIDVQVTGMGVGTITAAAIATDAIDADALAADAVAEINATVDTALSDAALATAANLATAQADLDTLTGTDGATLATSQPNYAPATAASVAALNDPTAAAIADAVWDEVITGAEHNVNTSAAKYLREGSQSLGVTGTAQAGGATSITLAADASATDDIYNNERVAIIEGTGAGQAKLITDYNGTTKVATVNTSWTVNPDNTSIYSIVGADVIVDAFDATARGILNAEVDTAISDAALATAANLATVDTVVDNILIDTTALNDTALPDSVPADGDIPTLKQAMYMVTQFLMERAVAGTTVTVKKADGSTSLLTLTLDDASAPTSISRAT